MSAKSKRWTFWGIIFVVGIVGLAYAFRPTAIPIDLTSVVRGQLVVTVDEEAETRIQDIYTVSAPVTGVALRIDADVGDSVIANNTILAEIEPVDPTFLDVRTEAELLAELKAAEAAQLLGRAEVIEAEAELEFATGERARTLELYRSGHVSERKRDDAERIYKGRVARLETAKAALMRRRFEVEQARAACNTATK